MRVMIATAGTRGDVQPYLALGQGLQAAGHSVAIATGPSFEEFVRASGLVFAPVAADPRQALQEDIRRVTDPLRFSRWVKRMFGPLALRYTAALLAACEGSDLLLANPLAFAAFHVCAAEVSERIRGEDGVGTAVQVIERLAASPETVRAWLETT